MSLPALFAGQKPEFAGNGAAGKSRRRKTGCIICRDSFQGEMRGWPLPEARSTLRLFFWRDEPTGNLTRKRRQDYGPFGQLAADGVIGGHGHCIIRKL
ncbi:MAG: hypothetical protein R2860_15215 [Desulfobacterales bacterium]